MSAPLKLKSERVGKVLLATENPFLSVLVDTGVFHLDQEFDYSLPAKFDIQVGDWVSVPFNGRNCLGLVTKRSPKSAVSKVSPINRGAKGVRLSKQHIDLYKAVADRWAVPIFDVLRFVTKYREASETISQGAGKRAYLQLSSGVDEIASIRQIANRSVKDGSTLVVVPEMRIAKELENEEFDVALRSGVLNPNIYKNLIVVREESEHHFELKSPGFNSRDVALLRSEILAENVLFLGYSPSFEMVRLIESGYVSFKGGIGKTNVSARPSLQGELLPSALMKNFKDALNKGPVLVIAPSKGYGLAISCANCKNVAKCGCGGKLTKSSKAAPPKCVLCAKEDHEWRCQFCKGERIYLIGRGIERIAEDFGKSFANTSIHIATADKEISGEIEKRSIVLATVGAAPLFQYSGVLILEGISLGSDMRSEERYLSTIFRYAAFAKGNVMMVERAEHPAVNSLIKWNPIPYLSRLLVDLAEAELPPYSRHLLIKSDETERIYSGFITATREGRLPTSVRVHNLDGVLSIFFNMKSAKQVLQFMYEFQKRRSMSGKPLLKMRVDPYLLG
jgi:primosomal protein N' (replication factor Y)